MIKFILLNKDYKPRNADFIFETLKDFNKIKNDLYRKIEGVWTVILIDATLDDIREILNSKELKEDYIDIDLVAKSDVLQRVYIEFPKLRVADKKPYEKYMDMLSNYPREFDKKASSILYNRCQGSPDLLREKLAELLVLTENNDDNLITTRLVNQVILDENIVYASDVVLTVFLKRNTKIPKRDNRYSKYKYKNYLDLYNQLVLSLGEKFAFYAIRKYINKLYKEKREYLENNEVKDIELMTSIDIFELANAVALFELSNYKQTIVLLSMMEERVKNDSNIKSVVLTCYDKCNSNS